ncbi:MAG: tandem-95 repeat protein [Caldilinea sp. CFX5]|nr:tandem-95 repeat protein [Caldilinea sp. CFX5]
MVTYRFGKLERISVSLGGVMATRRNRWLYWLLFCALLVGLLPPAQPTWAQEPPSIGDAAAASRRVYLPLIQKQADATMTDSDTPPDVGSADPVSDDGLVVLASDKARPASTCDLYPLALHSQSLTNVVPGTSINDILNGAGAGNFGWLSWRGDNSVQSLVTSLTPPGSAATYTNPNNPADHKVSIGDWVRGRPGVANAKAVREALDRLKQLDITVPVWGATQGIGANAQYQITDFALVRLTAYQLPGQNRISARFLGYNPQCRDNRPPLAADDTYTLNEDASLTVAAPGLLANDSDDQPQPLRATLVTNVAHGVVTLSANGAFVYTPTRNFNGQDHFTYQANDGLLNSAVATVTLTINPINDPPIAQADSAATDEDRAVLIAVRANDSAGPPNEDQSLTVTAVSAATNGMTEREAGDDVRYTPTSDFNGTDTFTYTICDSGNLCADATVAVVIGGVNDPPVAVDDRVAALEEMPVTFDVSANDSDVDGNLLPSSVMTLTNPTLGAVTRAAPGHFTYSPAPNANGLDRFRYTICDDGAPDGTPLCASATVTIEIAPGNDAPTAGADSYSTNEDATLTVAAPGLLANDSDVDGDSLTAAPGRQPDHGAVTLNSDGSFTYTPTADYCGSDTFTYRAQDGYGSTTTADVSLTVICINDAPVAQADQYSTNENTPLIVAAPGVLANDSDVEGDVLTLSNYLAPTHGTLTQNPDGAFTYTPTAGYCGQDSYRYTVIDGQGGSAEATVTLTVVCVNAPPVAVADSYAVDAGQTLIVAAPGMLGNDSDLDGDRLTATLVVAPAHGALRLNGDGSFTYTPTSGFAGVDSFTYQASDNSVDSNIATVTITVNAAPKWIQLFPSGAAPISRFYLQSGNAYDEANDRLIIFGGGSMAGHLSDLWVLVNATEARGPSSWLQLTPSNAGPTARTLHAAVYDPGSNRLIIYGGCGGNCGPHFADVWVLTNANGLGGTPTWLPLATAPLIRNGHAAAYDAAHNRMIVFGGGTTVVNSDQNEVWILTDANGIGNPTWQQLTPGGTPPPARGAPAAAVYDPHTNRLLVIAGRAGATAYNDVWILTNANGLDGTPQWLQLTPTGVPPAPRGGHTLVYDPTTNRALITAGGNYTLTTYYNDVWLLTNANGLGGAPQWVQQTPVDGPPPPRYTHISGYSPTANRLVIAFGHCLLSNSSAALNDVWLLTNANQLYTSGQTPPTPPVACPGTAPAATNDTYEGNANTPLVIPAPGVLTNDKSPNNTPLSAILVAAPLHGTLTLNPNGAFVYTPITGFSGTDTFTYKANDGLLDSNVATVTITVAVSSCTAGNWPTVPDLQQARHSHRAVLLHDGRVLVVGGTQFVRGIDEDLATVEIYNPATNVWVTGPDMSTPRSAASATLLPNGKVLIAGGERLGMSLTNAEIFDPTTNRWLPATSMGTPRHGHTATLLKDGRVLVVGGATRASSDPALSSAEIYDPQTNTWLPVASMSAVRHIHTATLLNNGQVLVAGGYSAPHIQATVNSAELYNPEMNTWTTLPAMSNPRAAHTALLLNNGHVLVTGGEHTGAWATSDLFDPATNSWLQVPNMSTPRTRHTVSLLPNGQVLVAGGAGNNVLSAVITATLYDPILNQWQASTNLKFARNLHTATQLCNGKILLVGGWTGSTALASVELYDPPSAPPTAPVATADNYSAITGQTLMVDAPGVLTNDSDPNGDPLTAILVSSPANGTVFLNPNGGFVYTPTVSFRGVDSFSYKANDGNLDSNVAAVTLAVVTPSCTAGNWPFVPDLAIARYEHVTVLLPDGRVLVIGGTQAISGAGADLTSTELYNPATNAWQLGPNLSMPRAAATGTLLPNGNVLLVGGEDRGTSLASVEIFDPDANTWTPAASMGTPRHGHTTTLLKNGQVLVIGGATRASSDPALSNAEIYNPQTNSWSSVASMSTGRHIHTATLLNNGQVLVTGGYAAPHIQATVNSAELYNPETNTWTTLPAMSNPRAAHTALLLNNGRVLVTGGEHTTAWATSDLFDPITNSWRFVPNMSTPRTRHTSTLLSNGQVLVAGGAGTSAAASAELYDRVLNRWQAREKLTVARNLHTATLLCNGKILLVGGWDNSKALASVELYDPDGAPPTAPEAVADDYNILAGQTLIVDTPGVLTNDSDRNGDPLTAVLVSHPAHGALTLDGNGGFVYTPTVGFIGSDTFTYKANDGQLDSNIVMVTITVDSPANLPPVANNDLGTLDEDTVLTVSAPGVLGNDNDPNGKPLTAVLVSNPAHGKLTLQVDGSYRYTPTIDFHGADSFTYRANNGQRDSNVATVSLTVASVNDPPVAVGYATAMPEDHYMVCPDRCLLGRVYDFDRDPLTVRVGDPPDHGTLDLRATGDFTYTPKSNFTGVDTFTFIANDGQIDSNTATITITVLPATDQPIAVKDSYTVNKDATLTVNAPGVLANDSDPDGGVLTAALLSGPAHGTLKLALNGSFIYTPTTGYSGADQFIYRARNANLFSEETLVTITVGGAPNQPPVATNDAYTATSNQPLTVAAPGLLTNDTDPNGDSLFALLVSSPTNGTVTLNANGAFVYTPTIGFNGTATFTYKANDGVLDSNVATVTLTVRGANRAPVASADSFIITAGQTLNVGAPGVLNNDSDPDNDALTAQLVNTVAHGTLTLNANGAFGYTPAAGFSGDDSFTYKANDGTLDSTVATVTITVRPAINDTTPPTVAITAPTDDATITTLTDLIGTATDANFERFVVEIAPVGQSGFTPIINSTTPVVDAKLGVIDPTLLVNDLYTVRLTAFDLAGNNASVAIIVQLAGNQKIGNFTVAFEDLNIGTACLPLNINRVYDSRDRTPGDFGMGWRLDIKTLRLRESQTMGSGWFVDLVDEPGPFGLLFPTYYLLDAGVHKVSLTLPDGHVEEFDLTPSPNRQQISPILAVTPGYTPRPGTLGTLAAEGNPPLVILDGQPGPVDLLDEADLTLFDPQLYRYTAPDGTIYRIDKAAGLQSIECTTGATLTFGPNGIVHSTGQGLTLVRDAQNRIVEVSDPNGNRLRYEYDAAGNLIRFTDAGGNVTRFTYNAEHYLLEIIDPRGVQGIRNDYDADGRLLGHTDATGEQISYTHDLAAKTETVTDRRGNRTVYAYDARGNVLRQTDALGNVASYSYDAFDNELTVTDPLGNTTTRTYDLRRNVLTEADPLGNITRFTYNAQNNVRTLTDALGRVTNYEYDGPGYLIRTIDALGNSTRNHYDSGGIVIPGTWNLLATTDALGNSTTYDYDNHGRVIKEIDALGHATTYSYDANGNRLTESMTRTTDSGVVTVVTTFTYDAQNRLVKTTYPDGSTTQTEYNAIGQQSATIDQLGRRTTYDYDLAGRLVKTTDPDGRFESSTYDAEGNRLTATDRAGRTTSFEYDALNRLVRTVYPDGSATSSSYDAAGRVVATTDERGNTTRYEYDVAGRRTKVIDALGHATTFTYDANGNQRTMTDANGNSVTYEYDALSRRTRTRFADGSSTVTTYDAVGRRIGESDQANKNTTFGYDALGRLVSVTDALGQVTRYSYDERGNQLTQRDANGHTTSFGYDVLGRRVRRTLPLGMAERYAYNSVGNLISKTDFTGKTTTYAYDDRNRLLSRTPDPSLNQPTVRFAYFPSGQRQRMEDAGGVTTYTYDQRDRLLSKVTPWGTLTYSYDAAGNLLAIRSSNANGVNVTYSYDELNRLSALDDQNLTAGVTTYAYDNAGNLVSYRYPNFVQHDYTYDQLNRLTNLSVHKGFAPLAAYAYTLGAAGNRLAVSELSGRTVNYAYDDLYRLTGETIANDPNGINGAIGYSYDPVGNRLARTSTVAPVPAATYSYDANDRLLSDSYDDNGNTIASDGKSYAYDFENRLINFNNGEVTMVYDGDGNRVAKTVAGATTHYLVDDRNLTGYAQVLEEIAGGVVQRQYTYGLDLVSQRQEISGTREVSFYGYDGQGSVRTLMEQSGGDLHKYVYDAFGLLISSGGISSNIYLFVGEQHDSTLGTYYLRARFYDAPNGRFLTTDPVWGSRGDPATLHKYLYVANDPQNKIDPSGQYYLLLPDILISSGARNLLAVRRAMAVYNTGRRLIEKAQFAVVLWELAKAWYSPQVVMNVSELGINNILLPSSNFSGLIGIRWEAKLSRAHWSYPDISMTCIMAKKSDALLDFGVGKCVDILLKSEWRNEASGVKESYSFSILSGQFQFAIEAQLWPRPPSSDQFLTVSAIFSAVSSVSIMSTDLQLRWKIKAKSPLGNELNFTSRDMLNPF